MLFEPKPCNKCPYVCVEGRDDVKCPFDIMVEDLLKNETTEKTYE